MASLVIQVAPFPDVPIAPGIPPMLRPTGVIAQVLGGENGLNATLSDPLTVASIIGEVTNSATLLANVPGAQALLASPGSAQSLLYSVPGVSTALTDVAAAQNILNTVPGLNTLLANVPAIQASQGGPSEDQSSDPSQPWGIFDSSNTPVVVADSVVKFEWVKDYKISDYPVEQGKFKSYNKVETPFEARVVLAKAGKLSDVTDFLTALQNAAAGTDLYSVSTPQFVYDSVNIDHLDYSQEATKGAYLLQVAVWMRQIRETAASTTQGADTTQSPSGADPVSGGTVQGQTPTSTQTAAATSTTLV